MHYDGQRSIRRRLSRRDFSKQIARAIGKNLLKRLVTTAAPRRILFTSTSWGTSVITAPAESRFARVATAAFPTTVRLTTENGPATFRSTNFLTATILRRV